MLRRSLGGVTEGLGGSTPVGGSEAEEHDTSGHKKFVRAENPDIPASEGVAKGP